MQRLHFCQGTYGKDHNQLVVCLPGDPRELSRRGVLDRAMFGIANDFSRPSPEVRGVLYE